LLFQTLLYQLKQQQTLTVIVRIPLLPLILPPHLCISNWSLKLTHNVQHNLLWSSHIYCYPDTHLHAQTYTYMYTHKQIIFKIISGNCIQLVKKNHTIIHCKKNHTIVLCYKHKTHLIVQSLMRNSFSNANHKIDSVCLLHVLNSLIKMCLLS